MAKNAVQSKSTRTLSLRDGPLFLGGATAAVLIFTLWYFSDPWTDFSNNPTNPVLASDGVTAAYCSSAAPDADELRHDSPNSTFYDDPGLGYSIEEPMEDWDEKRREWLENHPGYAGDRILLLTGSQPSPCSNPTGDHLFLRLFKNKVDYCRINGYDIFYSNAFLHPEMRAYWAKLPLIRAAMVAHPEAEWIWWVDSDAVFTDMEFKPPLRRYRDHNLIVHGWAHMVYEKKSWLGLNAGIFLIRNCQWSMDFMRLWASMGPMSPEFHKWGWLQKSALPDKMFRDSDDQSALIYLVLKGEKKWTDKIYIEGEYYFHGYWLDIVGTVDDVTERYVTIERGVRGLRRRHAEKMSGGYAALREQYLSAAGYGKGSWRRPFITHFTGCQHCNGEHDPKYESDSCWIGMVKALNFADNQVLRMYGFVRPDLSNASRLSVLPFDYPAAEEEDHW